MRKKKKKSGKTAKRKNSVERAAKKKSAKSMPRKKAVKPAAKKKPATRAPRKKIKAARQVVAFRDAVEDHVLPAQPVPSRASVIFRVQGRMSTFGGPNDHGVSPTEGLALFERADLNDPRFADLFLPYQPPGTTGLARRLNPDQFYLACRWDYRVTSRSFLRNTYALVQSVASGEVRAARPADWGPHDDTARVADLSPGLADALKLDTDDEVIVTIRGADVDFVTPEAARTFNGANGPIEPKIYTAEEWGAEPAHVNYFPERPAAGIVVHNTQGKNRAPLQGDDELNFAKKLAQEIQRSHMVTDHHWMDTGQHFTVTRGGLILEGRHGSVKAARTGKVVEASHAVSADGSANRTWFGIEVEGDNRQSDQVTSFQYDALVELCAWLTKWRGVNALTVLGHQDVLSGHTDCPGKLEARLPKLRKDIAALRAQLG